MNFDQGATAVLLALTALLFVAGFLGASRMGLGRPRAWWWGIASALVGVGAVVLKLVV